MRLKEGRGLWRCCSVTRVHNVTLFSPLHYGDWEMKMSQPVVFLLVVVGESILLGLALVNAIGWLPFIGATIAAALIAIAMTIFSLGDSLIGRRLRVFAVAVTVFADYKVTRQRAKWAKSDEKQDELWERAHERNAKRVFKAIVKLEGLWVKAGQYLSTRADVLPEPYIRSLKLLQDQLPPRPLCEVLAIIERELGKPPDVLYDFFDETPLATASIAQVHRARTKEGMEIVVKVQHSGVKERILQDLENLRTIVEWVAWSEPSYDFGPVVEEWCTEVPKELDFVNEAENTRKVAENLSQKNHLKTASGMLGIHVDVLLPDVVQATERVLVLTYMEGVRLNDAESMESLGVDKQALVESITRAYAHQIYVDGFFNADPHPGNFLVSKKPPFKPVLLDFGLVKALTMKMKLALAKLLVAAAENDYAGLLSSFHEMGLKLSMDMPEDAMAITSFFFRKATPAHDNGKRNDSPNSARTSSDGNYRQDEVNAWRKEREDRLRRQKRSDEKSLRRSPVDAFPGEAVFFMRVLNLLRGLSSSLNARVIYLDIMRPFAEATLYSGNMAITGLRSPGHGFVLDSPLRGEVDVKLRQLLSNFGLEGKILGIQVCVYKNGQIVVDAAAGVMGKYDPRPVQLDSLFPVFSATKGVTAALVHWLAEQGKLALDAPVSSVWPEFSNNGKEGTTVAHVLSHRAGLPNALTAFLLDSPFTMCNWKDMVRRIARERPETAPGSCEQYHYLSFGWLAGAIVEKASGREFKKVLRDAFARPLQLEGEFFVGIPPGVESRLVTLSRDTDEVKAQFEDSQQQPTASTSTGTHTAWLPSMDDKGVELLTSASSFTSHPAWTSAPTSTGTTSFTTAYPDGDEDFSEEVTSGSMASLHRPGTSAEFNKATTSRNLAAAREDLAEGPLGEGGSGLENVFMAAPLLFNALFVRRACIPSANGHFSARALARFYAMLAAGGEIPSVPVSEPDADATSSEPLDAEGGENQTSGLAAAKSSTRTVGTVSTVTVTSSLTCSNAGNAAGVASTTAAALTSTASSFKLYGKDSAKPGATSSGSVLQPSPSNDLQLEVVTDSSRTGSTPAATQPSTTVTVQVPPGIASSPMPIKTNIRNMSPATQRGRSKGLAMEDKSDKTGKVSKPGTPRSAATSRSTSPWRLRGASSERGSKPSTPRSESRGCSANPFGRSGRASKPSTPRKGASGSTGDVVLEMDPEPAPENLLFRGPKTLDAMLGIGDYAKLCLDDGLFGLGFQRYKTDPVDKSSKKNNHCAHGSDDANDRDSKEAAASAESAQGHDMSGAGAPGQGRKEPSPNNAAQASPLFNRQNYDGWAFGHTGMGGTIAFCNPAHDFAIAITLNKLSLTAEVTAAVVRLVCTELDVPLPTAFSKPGLDAVRLGSSRETN